MTTTLRGMVAHKLRLALTTASIALGVAFLAGTLVMTDTMGAAFERLFDKVSSGTDSVKEASVRTTASVPAETLPKSCSNASPMVLVRTCLLYTSPSPRDS